MSLSGLISKFESKVDQNALSFQQFCRLIGGKTEYQASILIKLGQIQAPFLPLDGEIAILYQKKILHLKMDFRLLLELNYQWLKGLALYLPIPKGSWNQKLLSTTVHTEEEMALMQALIFLQTSEMPYLLAQALDMANAPYLKKILEVQEEQNNSDFQNLLLLLSDPPQDFDYKSLQLFVCRTAAFASYPHFLSFFDCILQWQDSQLELAQNFFQNCKFLRSMIKTRRISQCGLKNISFQQYLIVKTREQILQICVLEEAYLENVTEDFKYEGQRRTISFFIYVLQDLFDNDNLCIGKTLPNGPPLEKANIVFKRLSLGVSKKNEQLMYTLMHIRVLQLFIPLKESEKNFFFKWIYDAQPLSPFFVKPFIDCYTVFCKSNRLNDQGFTLFRVLLDCQYYLDLDQMSLEYVLQHLSHTNFVACLNELQQYADCLKITLQDNPLVKRDDYLKKTIDNYSGFYKGSTWKWKTFKKENCTLQFLQSVENCTTRTLPIEFIIKAFCYPFYRESAVALVNQLNDLKMTERIESLFLYERFNAVMVFISQLQESENILHPGMNWLSEMHPLTIPCLIGDISHLLNEAVFPTLSFMKSIAKSSIIAFPSHQKYFPKVTYLQNTLTLFNKGCLKGLVFLARWQESHLEITFLLSMENPQCTTLQIPFPFNKETQPFYKNILQFFLNNLHNEIDINAENIQEEFQLTLQHLLPAEETNSWQFYDRNFICKLFSFVKQLKIEARFAISSLFYKPRVLESNPLTLAAQKKIYLLPNGLSLLPPEITLPEFCLFNSSYSKEFAIAVHAIKKRKAKTIKNLFIVKMYDGTQQSVDLCFHTAYLRSNQLKPSARGRYNQVTLSINNITYTIHYKKYAKSKFLDKLLRFQLLMLQSHYYQQPSSLIWDATVRQEERFDYQFSSSKSELCQTEHC